MRLAKPKVGKLVLVRFWDHTENVMEPALIEAVGWVEAVVKDPVPFLRLAAWRSVESGVEFDKDNTTRFEIVLSTITVMKELKETE